MTEDNKKLQDEQDETDKSENPFDIPCSHRRYIYRYIACPLLGVAVIVSDIIAAASFLQGEKIVAVSLIAAASLIFVAMMAAGEYVARRDISDEMERYELDCTKLASKDGYRFPVAEGGEVCFDKNGMTLEDSFYWYNHMRILIGTNNHNGHVWIFLGFFDREKNEIIRFLLSAELLKMMDDLEIQMSDRVFIEYIIMHRREAFSAVYRRGRFNTERAERLCGYAMEDDG